MAFLSKSDLNRIVGASTKQFRIVKSMTDARVERSADKEYDVFLSHSYSDRETILQVNYFLEEIVGLDVFVDWIEKPGLDRSAVTPKTAAEMRDVMDRCATLVFAVSTTSSTSKWMPWELGYSDAKHGRVAVLPIADAAGTVAAYQNQEFVGIYPHIEYDPKSDDHSGNKYLWVHDPLNSNKYSLFSNWKDTGILFDHP